MSEDKKVKWAWPPPVGFYPMPDNRPPCRHTGKPSEPWAKHAEFGSIVSITPAANGIPAMAYVDWGDFQTWERLADLRAAQG